ncbi:MAG: insulinase family protein [Clostridiales bacterium]|nr:insulinase family protein [Clostridiales bacterium]
MVDITTLGNGIPVLLEPIPLYQSASVGFFVDTGSRHERPEQSGLSHFIEHMLFKGTTTRSSADIARAFDLIGGQFNAYTAKEMTCFYAKTLNYHVLQALDLLGDMLRNPLLDPRDIATEQGVVLEEMGMVEDSPDDLVVERLIQGVWGPVGLGGPILGRPETVSAFDRAAICAYLAEGYTAGTLVLSVAGSFEREAVLERLEQLFGDLPPASRRPAPVPPVYTPAVVLAQKEIEQNHLCFCFEGYGVGDSRGRALSVLSNILGDGMSSRLFQRLREQEGLVYTVYSFLSGHSGCGLLGIYSAQQPGKEEPAAFAVLEELRRLKREGVEEEELLRAKEMLKTSLVMSFESSHARMSFNAREYLRYGRVREVSELLEELDGVDQALLRQVTAEVLDGQKLSLSVVGRLRDEGFYHALKV